MLLDHLVDGSKEAQIAASVDHPDVVITGHPYVDVWQAVKPRVIGIDRWPDIPPGQLWKEGVIAALGPQRRAPGLLEMAARPGGRLDPNLARKSGIDV